jgi:hypothetical protein
LIVRFVDIGGIGLNFILKNRYLGIVRFVDIGAHHCLNFIYWDVIVRFVDIGGINDNLQQTTGGKDDPNIVFIWKS